MEEYLSLVVMVGKVFGLYVVFVVIVGCGGVVGEFVGVFVWVVVL